MASRARRRIRASQPSATPTARQAGIVRDFKRAWEAKDIDALIGLLDPDATVIADGGGLVSAALRPIEGREQIARGAVDLAALVPGLTLLERTVNGQPGLVAQQTTSPLQCSRSRSRATGSPTSGQYATPTSSGPGRQADTRCCPA